MTDSQPSIEGPCVEVKFSTYRELSDYLAARGFRVARWFADGAFTTEPIPCGHCGHINCDCNKGGRI